MGLPGDLRNVLGFTLKGGVSLKLVKMAGAVGLAAVLVRCVSTPVAPKAAITVRWQRLVTAAGETCDRCLNTQEEVGLAADTLRRCLRPLNIDVALQETPMTAEACARDVSQSNRVFVDDRSLEDWLGAEVGRSRCGSCCAQLGQEVHCRTVVVDGQAYEVIPARLIVRAGLLAAEAALARQPVGQPCCPPGK